MSCSVCFCLYKDGGPRLDFNQADVSSVNSSLRFREGGFKCTRDEQRRYSRPSLNERTKKERHARLSLEELWN